MLAAMWRASGQRRVQIRAHRLVRPDERNCRRQPSYRPKDRDRNSRRAFWAIYRLRGTPAQRRDKGSPAGPLQRGSQTGSRGLGVEVALPSADSTGAASLCSLPGEIFGPERARLTDWLNKCTADCPQKDPAGPTRACGAVMPDLVDLP